MLSWESRTFSGSGGERRSSTRCKGERKRTEMRKMRETARGKQTKKTLVVEVKGETELLPLPSLQVTPLPEACCNHPK